MTITTRPPAQQTTLRIETRVWGRFASLADTNGSTVANEIQAAATRLPDGHEGLRESRPDSRDVQRVTVSTAAYERLRAYAVLHGCSIADALVRAYELHAGERIDRVRVYQKRTPKPPVRPRQRGQEEIAARARSTAEVAAAVRTAVELVRSGMSISTASAQMHLRAARVSAACRDAGLQIRPAVPLRTNPEQVRQLVLAGLSDKSVAGRVGARRSTITQAREDLGLEERGGRAAA